MDSQAISALPVRDETSEETRLAQLDCARQALASAKRLPEVKQIRDLAAAFHQFAKQQQYTLEIQNDAAELKLQAERKAGALLRVMDKATGAQGQARGSTDGSGGIILQPPEPTRDTLTDLGITKTQSHRWQTMATVPEDAFVAHVHKQKATGQELTSAGVYTMARAAQKTAARQARMAEEQRPVTSGLVTLCLGDYATVGADLPPASVDLLLTDPPYHDTFVPQLVALGQLASRVLKPGGSLLALYGQRSLRQAMSALDQHLTYQWVFSYRLHGSALAVWSASVLNHWKPLLWYVNGTYTGPMQGDVLESERTPDKDFHVWGQAEAAFALLIKRFTAPGDVVLDPLCGGGTTGAAAVKLRRRFIGIDIDTEALAMTRARLADILLYGASDNGCADDAP